jgi:hypothetical protein
MVGRIALTFSLFFISVCAVLAGPYADLDRQLKLARSEDEQSKILQASPLVQKDPKLSSYLIDDPDAHTDPPSGPRAAAEVIELRAMAETTTEHGNARDVASQIKHNPFYADPGERESTNWLGRAFQRLRNLHWDRPKPKMTTPNLGFLGDWFILFSWFVLGVAVLCFLLYAAKNVDFSKLGFKRKAKTLLEEAEPDRTLDEWLSLADQLEAEGRYREAVRGLYLACLLKLDEARVARFDRGQTNWEHLARFEASPKRPVGLEFRKPTQAFDLIWYGHRVNGSEDVNRFRQWYRQIVEATKDLAA